MLLHLYATHAWPAHAHAKTNGVVVANGHVENRHLPASRHLRDSEEFELEGLMSDDDDDDESRKSGGGTREVNGNLNANANGRAT